MRMNKKSLNLFFVIGILLVLSFTLISAGWFSDFWAKITGQATTTGTWTSWYDRDDPSGSGDYEYLASLRNQYPGQICASPTQIDCQTTGGTLLNQTGQNVTCNINDGLVCLNVNNLNECLDYRVRFYCGESTTNGTTTNNTNATTPPTCVSCAAPNSSCRYVNGSCSSCGTLLCEGSDGPILTMNITCTDSDGGKIPYINGTTGYVKDGVSDYENDTCGYYGIANTLGERYCSYDGARLIKLYTCPAGCVNGACVPYKYNKTNKEINLNLDIPLVSSEYYGNVFSIELISASDSTATIKIKQGASFDGISQTKEISEGTSKDISAFNIYLKSADEDNGYLSAILILSLNQCITESCLLNLNIGNIAILGNNRTLQLVEVHNQTEEIIGDEVIFSDTVIGNTYETIFIDNEGEGILNLDGKNYNIIFSGSGELASVQIILGSSTPTSATADCDNGCSLDGNCYPYNNRNNGSYCAVGGQWIPQSEDGASCDNNFECSSNICVSNQCIEGSLIQRILAWFRELFG